MTPVRLASLDALADPRALEPVVGPLEAVERSPLTGVGFSGSRHERLGALLRSGERRRLVLKRTTLASDWTAYRSGDRRGREAALLEEPALAGIWEVFACPYLAYATEAGEVGLLMDDLSPYLLPDVDAPISVADEDRLLSALAGLHARYWESAEARPPWLMPLSARFGLLGPRAPDEERDGRSNPALFALVRRGWELVFARLPPRLADLLLRPAEALAAECADLPWTLIHGDAKVANFGSLPGGRVAAFDWEMLGIAPATLDLGYYLAVNAGRLARSKAAVVARYRGLLEAGLGAQIPSGVWERMVSVGLLYAGAVLLWSKAVALESGSQRALEEWDWWVDQLQRRW
jgi:hypothetical protein